jgi:hypothetical protein
VINNEISESDGIKDEISEMNDGINVVINHRHKTTPEVANRRSRNKRDNYLISPLGNQPPITPLSTDAADLHR